MLFSADPGAGSAGPTSSPYTAYTHHLAHPSALPHPVAPQHQLKSYQQAALVSSMLQASNPNQQSDLISSLNYRHHHHQIESEAGPVPPGIRATGASGVESKSASNSNEAASSHQQRTNRNGSPICTGNQNDVRNVMLYGVPIVSLVMDGQERLCLAQISNTLLKRFSYNEIHNRRVALGITCVQCTPVQLELLRRAGAMPVSSRRCGMITKREAERLCKSFLAEAEPPKLPDTFSFDVFHACAWGCRGNFTPSRYNSSRAKCIKCVYCGLFFSPNKFIFHSHRLPTSKYVQPDAANFNSWRRHIRLVHSPEPPEHVSYAWEDVKAMFNGGSRKRAMSSTLNSFTKNQESSAKSLARDKQAMDAKYKFSDENSGLDDSDDYCSMDASPPKKSNMASNDSCEGNTNSNPTEPDESSPVPAPNPYNSFSQKGIFESHFKKAFEVSSLIGNSQTKSFESGKNSRGQPSPSKLPSSSNSEQAVHPKSSESISSFSFSPIESYLESAKNGAMSKQISAPQAVVPPPQGPYLGPPSSEQALVASYNGLFGGHHFSRQHQLTDPRMTSTHPAILSTLLNGMPESATPQHFRSSGLLANYVQVPPMAPPNGTTSDMSQPNLLNPTPVTTGPQAEFRHNLAEFMWSMASKAATPAPYNFLWSPAAGSQASHSQQMSNPMATAQAPINTSHSSSSSSTPTLSPNQSQQNEVNEALMGNGSLFGFKSNNADDIRKALLLNSNLLHQQRAAAASNLAQMHPNSGMPFLPNLIGHNLRLVHSNGNAGLPGTAPLPPNYMLTKEPNCEGSESNRNKSPNSSSQSQSSLSGVPSPLFPFRSAFTAAPNLDRFSSEMFAARNQFLFDTYHNSSMSNGRALFHPHFLFDKQRFEEPNNNNNEADRESHRTIDVIGDDNESQEMTIKSIYPFSYSRSHTTKTPNFNKDSKTSRKNAKKFNEHERRENKQGTSFRVKSSNKSNDDLIVLDDPELMPSLEMNHHIIVSDEEPAKDGEKNVTEECCKNKEVAANEAEDKSANTYGNSQSRQNSPIASQSPNQENYNPYNSAGQSPPSNGKMLVLLGSSENCTSNQSSPGNQTIKLVT